MAAPVAKLDDEWENFGSFSSSDDLWQKAPSSDGNNVEQFTAKNFDNNEHIESLQFSELVSYESMGDLVHSFDEKLASCFRVANTHAKENVFNLPLVSMEDFNHDNLWKCLTGNYGLVQPLNWKTSHIRKLHIPALCLPFHGDKENEEAVQTQCKTCSIETDDDVANNMDYHSMIEYNVYTENESRFLNDGSSSNSLAQTADEVIEELEEIMKVADDFNAAIDCEVQEETGIVFNESLISKQLKEDSEKSTYRQSFGSMSSIEESACALELKSMSLLDLNAENEEMEKQVQFLSTELLDQLNKRDELQYEIEVKHSFISKVLEVQYKQAEMAKAGSSSKKFSGLRKSATSDSVSSSGKYLTTLIPCNKGDVLTTNNLQSLIKILDAMKMDSEEVPSLLTAYILQVVCPAPSSKHILQL